MVSQGTLTNFEQKVEISVSTGFQKGAWFFFLLSLGASPELTNQLNFCSLNENFYPSKRIIFRVSPHLLGVNLTWKMSKVAKRSMFELLKLYEKLFHCFYSLFLSSWCSCNEKLRRFGQYFPNLSGKSLREKVQNAKKVDQLAQLLPLKNLKTLRY